MLVEGTVRAVYFGLISNPPERPRRGVTFWWSPASTRAQKRRVMEFVIQLPGVDFGGEGGLIVTVGRGLHGGSFESIGHVRPHVTGTFRCR